MENLMHAIPRPVKPGLYNDGTHDWEWDGESWEVISTVPDGMPTAPARDNLRRVNRAYTDLTDADFLSEPIEPHILLERILTGSYNPDLGEVVTVGGVKWVCADAGQGFPGYFRGSVTDQWIMPHELNNLIRVYLAGRYDLLNEQLRHRREHDQPEGHQQ